MMLDTVERLTRRWFVVTATMAELGCATVFATEAFRRAGIWAWGSSFEMLAFLVALGATIYVIPRTLRLWNKQKRKRPPYLKLVPNDEEKDIAV